MSQAIFLSHYLSLNAPLYGGQKNLINYKVTSSIQNGDTANSGILSFPNHAGTHIDFPKHFDDKGKKIQDYKPDFWIFKKVGLIIDKIKNIEKHFISQNKDIEFLIIKTGFGQFRGEDKYWKSQPIIPANLAGKIKSSFPKIRAVGFDMISLTSRLDRDEGKKAHLQFLLEHDILVVEDMNLENLYNKPKNLIVSPLLFENLDGSPCTIIASI